MVVLSCFCVFCGWFLLLESFSAERKLNPRPGKSLDKLEEVNHKGTKTQTRSESAWWSLVFLCLCGWVLLFESFSALLSAGKALGSLAVSVVGPPKIFLISLIQKVENLHNLEEVWR